MERRRFLAVAGGPLAATLGGCLGGPSGGGGGDPSDTPRTDDDTTDGFIEETETPRTDDDTTEGFLEENETPESDGAREFLATVKEETDGLYRFKGDDDTERIGFKDGGDTWEIRYYGSPHAGEDRYRAEIATLSTAFVSNRPDGVSLTARSLHECTTGKWQVSADTAAAYERDELDRTAFVDRVYSRAEIVNNC